MATKTKAAPKAATGKANLPVPADVFDQLPAVIDEAVTAEGGGLASPYCVFIHQKAKCYADVASAIKGVKEPDVVLIRPAPEQPILIEPFEFYLLTAQQYWAEVTPAGEIIAVTFDNPGRSTTFKENIDTAIIAIGKRDLYAARMTFRSTKAPAARAAISALTEANTPEWGAKSPEHRATLAAPKACFRFVTSVSCAPRTSKSTGLVYHQASATVRPSTPNDWALLGKYLNNGGPDAIRQVIDAHQARMKELQNLAKSAN